MSKTKTTDSALRAAAPDLLRKLVIAVERIEVANAEGDLILSAWLPGACAAITAATGREYRSPFFVQGIDGEIGLGDE